MEDATDDIVRYIEEIANKNHLDYFHLEIIIASIHNYLIQQVQLQKQQDRENYVKSIESQNKKGKED